MTNQTKNEGNILIVDDTPDNLTVLRQMLEGKEYKIRPALNGDIALKAVRLDLPDLILLDIRMPDMDGYEVCRQLKSDPTTRQIPVIFISALNDLDDKIKAFSVGGKDYISKPFKAEEVVAKVSTYMELKRYRDQLEELVEERTNTLEKANKVQNQFLLNLHNKLQSPINDIIKASTLALDFEVDPDLEKVHKRIQTSGVGLLKTVTRLLDSNKSGDDDN